MADISQENGSQKDTIYQEIGALLKTLGSVQLATLNATHEAEISYAPYIKRDDFFYIFISELAAHTQNLKLNPDASLMFIADESASKTIFARKRLVLKSRAELISRQDSQWNIIMDDFEAIHGNTITLLKTLSDFYLFQFTPIKGIFIKGFGQAFSLTGSNLTSIEQIKGR
jgi:heme oxygenase (biliverdin-IX-beta and delta-forming)